MFKQRENVWFQLTWAALHMGAAFLHIGSAVYHAKRVRKEREEDERSAQSSR